MTTLEKTGTKTDSGARPDFDAVVVGAGFSGLYMLRRLRDVLGLSARVYEAGGDVGGTWYWNRYPGARCDSESIYYCFSDNVSEELLQEWTWSERFAAQPEILRYLQFVADRLDLRRDIQFNTRITAAHWDEAANLWRIHADDGTVVTATYFISALGCLSQKNLPDFKGLDSFQGDWYHTGAWPHEGVDFTGKRVAVIGTGATAVQVVPEVAKQASHLYVFQRTPNYDIPGENRPLDEAYMQSVKASYREIWRKARDAGNGFPYQVEDRSALSVTPEERQAIFEAAWKQGGFYVGFGTFNDFLLSKEANDTIAEFIRSKIRETVHDPEVADLLSPKDYPFLTKRPPLEHGYYEAFNRDNVTLVDIRRSSIEEITPRGVRAGGKEYEVDSIIFATGFDAMTGALLAIDIRGTGGQTLKEHWADGPLTYLGLATNGFPNMFTITGPQSPSVLTNMPVAIEQHVEWISDCIAYMREHGLSRIEAQREAEDGWVDHANQIANMTLLLQTDSWWVGANIPGKKRIAYPYVGGLGNYRKVCDDVAANGYKGFELSAEQVTSKA
ncbi:MAG TPA: NAD(P)/FAD-dependent oxidoreductase [Dehalococcoidia bacterium]|nr:NAD(P)/FAD-dependent oxidoreductase [Dehalococcoidia bacterium]